MPKINEYIIIGSRSRNSTVALSHKASTFDYHYDHKKQQNLAWMHNPLYCKSKTIIGLKSDLYYHWAKFPMADEKDSDVRDVVLVLQNVASRVGSVSTAAQKLRFVRLLPDGTTTPISWGNPQYPPQQHNESSARELRLLPDVGANLNILMYSPANGTYNQI